MWSIQRLRQMAKLQRVRHSGRSNWNLSCPRVLCRLRSLILAERGVGQEIEDDYPGCSLLPSTTYGFSPEKRRFVADCG